MIENRGAGIALPCKFPLKLFLGPITRKRKKRENKALNRVVNLAPG
jgi:hypothetical protein